MAVPGSPATYANRAALRAIGLRWDPVGHRWHGTTTTEGVRELRERLGLEVRVFGALDTAPKGPTTPRPAHPERRVPGPGPIAVPARNPARRPHEGSRTRFESRVAFSGPDEDAEEIATPTRRFSVLEITSGLPDDSREEDERAAQRELHDLRSRVKIARAVVSTTPGLAEVLRNDWRGAARFYARIGITESQFRLGVDVNAEGEGDIDNPGSDA